MKAVLILVRTAQVLFAIVGVWQVITLSPALAFSGGMTPGMWMFLGIKLSVLLLCLLALFGLSRLARRLRPVAADAIAESQVSMVAAGNVGTPMPPAVR